MKRSISSRGRNSGQNSHHLCLYLSQSDSLAEKNCEQIESHSICVCQFLGEKKGTSWYHPRLTSFTIFDMEIWNYWRQNWVLVPKKPHIKATCLDTSKESELSTTAIWRWTTKATRWICLLDSTQYFITRYNKVDRYWVGLVDQVDRY